MTVLAVTAIPDEKRGERLVVLYTPDAGSLEQLRAILERCELPNLWKPGADGFYAIDQLPLLGSGKTDYRALKDILAQR